MSWHDRLRASRIGHALTSWGKRAVRGARGLYRLEPASTSMARSARKARM